MNFSPQTKAWIQLISLVVGTGTGASIAAITGGCHIGMAIIIGVGVAATNIAHALSASPNEQPVKSPMQDIGKP